MKLPNFTVELPDRDSLQKLAEVLPCRECIGNAETFDGSGHRFFLVHYQNCHHLFGYYYEWMSASQAYPLITLEELAELVKDAAAS